MIHNKIVASIIIPIYNTEKYLERCLSSVIAIKNSNIEIIIVDDGSSDGSALIYEKYAGRDKRINVIKMKNEGVSSARNKGIQIAVGKWITFIDSDDEIIPAKYDSVLMQLNSTSELWMFGTLERRSEFSNSEREIIQGIWLNKDIDGIKKAIFDPDTIIAKKLREQGFVLRGPFAKFYLRQIIVENNILFPGNIRIGEDCVFNFLYLNYIKSISYTNDCVYYYWQNNDSVMHKFGKGNGEHYLYIIEVVQDILAKEYLSEYAQFGVRQYLQALKSDWCNTHNQSNYFIRKKEAMEWRNNRFVQEAFQNFKLSRIRWEAVPIALCAKMKWFLLCDILLKIKEKLHIRFK